MMNRPANFISITLPPLPLFLHQIASGENSLIPVLVVTHLQEKERKAFYRIAFPIRRNSKFLKGKLRMERRKKLSRRRAMWRCRMLFPFPAGNLLFDRRPNLRAFDRHSCSPKHPFLSPQMAPNVLFLPPSFSIRMESHSITTQERKERPFPPHQIKTDWPQPQRKRRRPLLPYPISHHCSH